MPFLYLTSLPTVEPKSQPRRGGYPPPAAPLLK